MAFIFIRNKICYFTNKKYCLKSINLLKILFINQLSNHKKKKKVKKKKEKDGHIEFILNEGGRPSGVGD